MRGLGVVGDAEILEAALARGLGHRLQGLRAVGGIGVAMKDSAQVLVGDELRQLALQGQLDLAAALTEFRIDEGQTEGTIDLGLVAGDQGAALVQAVGLQPHSLLNGQGLELLNVSGGAGGEEKSGAEVFAIGQADLHSIRPGSLRRFGDLGRFCNDREVADQFAAAAEVARDRHALEFGPGLAERILGVGEQDGGTVQMEAAFSAFRDGQVLQDLGLQRGAETFGLLDTVVLGGGLQLGERGDTEILVKPQHLLGAEAGNGEHLEHALGYLLPELFEARMRARLVKLGDNVGDRLADAGDFLEPVFGDQHMQRDGKGCQAVGGPGIGFCPVGVAAAQGGALRIFPQQICYTTGVEGRHSTSLPSRVLRPRRTKASPNARAFVRRTVERPLQPLRCPEVFKVLRIRAVSGLFLEKIIDPPGQQLQMLHPAVRHGSGLA